MEISLLEGFNYKFNLFKNYWTIEALSTSSWPTFNSECFSRNQSLNVNCQTICIELFTAFPSYPIDICRVYHDFPSFASWYWWYMYFFLFNLTKDLSILLIKSPALVWLSFLLFMSLISVFYCNFLPSCLLWMYIALLFPVS